MPSEMCNADRTVVFSEMPHNYAINFKGEKQVAMKITGFKKLCVTATLCIITNGSKLPPYVILNGKTKPKENICKNVIVQAQKNAWTTLELMEDCLDVYGNVSLEHYQSHGVC
jgi:hypothetical protein